MKRKNQIFRAFKELRKEGYFAEMNFTCCQTCGWAEVPEDKINKAVFYHYQDAQQLKDYGHCFLAWDGNPSQIIEILKKYIKKVEWDGSKNSRIKITLW